MTRRKDYLPRRSTPACRALAAHRKTIKNGQAEIDKLLRQEHNEDYCGIVYADDIKQPAFVKIYDPNNLGVSCGYSDNPPLPGWVMSKLPPCDLPATRVLPANRKRWWRRLFGA